MRNSKCCHIPQSRSVILNMVYSTTLGLLMAASAAVAQTGGQPSFEVASVKPSAPITSKEGKMRVGKTISGARVEMNFVSLADLVQTAYRVKPYQVAGPLRFRPERVGRSRFLSASPTFHVLLWKECAGPAATGCARVCH